MNYQLFEVLPYYINYYVLKKEVKLDNLYHNKIWDHSDGVELQSTKSGIGNTGWGPFWRARTTEQDSIEVPPEEPNDGIVMTRRDSHNSVEGHGARSRSSSMGTFD